MADKDMMMRFYRHLAMLLSLLAGLVFSEKCRAGERITLNGACIVTSANQPSFVRYAIEDLAAYIKECTGNAIPIVTIPTDKGGIKIVVGAETVQQVLPDQSLPKELGEEGYVLKAVPNNGGICIVATGNTPRGTKLALAVLMKAIAVDGRTAFIPASLNLSGKPAFAKRGMHFNGWAINYPYSFRAWTEKDWQRYLDILSYQGVNLFYFWPFMECMPVPLSAEDQEYLEECRRVVDYAHNKHGMEVWIMQCTNRVAKDRCGVADPRLRPYWRASQQDLNPGNPEDFKTIMASREAMYKIINNVDGVCNIDSDPGNSTPNNTLQDYVNVLCGCREILDRCNIHGKKTKLIHWMWFGWARPENVSYAEHQIPTVQAVKKGLAEPWKLICGRYEFLSVCRQEGVLGKAVFLPYGEIEGEPAYPHTNVQTDRIRIAFNDTIIKNPELGGVMGNVQTPLLQFPHVYFYTSILLDLDCRKRTEKEVLLEVSKHLYPDHGQLLADCYLALKESDTDEAEDLANSLDRLVREGKLGRLGTFGRKLFPEHSIVARSLVLQLKLRAAKERLTSCLAPTITQEKCEELLYNFCAAYLAWEAEHGWHKRKVENWREWPFGASPWDKSNIMSLYPAANNIRNVLGSDSEIDACLNRVAERLSADNEPDAVKDGCITPLKNIFKASQPTNSLAQTAVCTASVSPNPARYPSSSANDGKLWTRFWPGVLTQDNSEWIQLSWDKPQTFSNVVVTFQKHPSMNERTIHLQKEAAPGQWENIATAKVSDKLATEHTVATFSLQKPVTLSKIRIVNLIDLFEIEVR